MSELKLVSPLLDHMDFIHEMSSGNGTTVYLMRNIDTKQEYVLKHISIPESQTQIDALLITGAASDEKEAHVYFRQIVDDYKNELRSLDQLEGSSNIALYSGCQICDRDSHIGFDIYLLSEKWTTLQEYIADNAMTHLRSLNLGLDLCSALCELRSNGLIHRDVKLENVYLSGLNSFMIGDLGVAAIEDLKYCSMPERMISAYTAPEITDIMNPFNTTIDIYSVGMILYRILNGNHAPFEDEQTSAKAANAMRNSGTPLPAPLYSDYELSEIILKACAFEPAERYQMPEELMQDLVAYMKRNRVSDTLIVPPIVADDDILLPAQYEEEEIEPVRFTDIEGLDEDFVNNFSPDAQIVLDSMEAVQEPVGKSTASVEIPEADDTDADMDMDDDCTYDDQSIVSFPAFASPSMGDDELPIITGQDAAVPAEKQKKKKKKSKNPKTKKIVTAITAGVLALAIICVGVYYFVLGGPALAITGMVASSGIDSVTISLSSNSKLKDIKITCTDTYGNVLEEKVVEETVTFEGLSPATQYQIQAVSTSNRKLSGNTETVATTAASTEIVSFSASSTLAGQIDLSVIISGPEPEQWTVHYSAEGLEEKTAQFSGHTVTISDLEPNILYTFTLEVPEGIVLSGTSTLEYSSGPEVSITNLATASLSKNSVRVTWESGENRPEQWMVTCTGTDGSIKTQTVTDLEAEFLELLSGETYTITVTSAGTAVPATITVTPTAATVTSFTAVSNESGSIETTWETDSAALELKILCSVKNGTDSKSTNVTGGQATISGLVPGATYNVELQTVAGEKLGGNAMTEVVLAPAGKFTSHGTSSFFIGTFMRPTAENWNRGDLATGTAEFAPADKIAFAIDSLSGVSSSTDETRVTIVVKDVMNTVVSSESYTTIWDDMWDGTLFVGELKDTPSSGTYELEVYFDNKLTNSKSFTVS